MNVLVTGAAGFTGTHLADLLSTIPGVEMTGLVRPGSSHPCAPGFLLVRADLLDRDGLHAALSENRPDAVVHLAGLNQGAFDELIRTNVIGTKNLLDAIADLNPACRVLVVSSSAVYGYAGDAPLSEETPARPLSEYGISKLAQDALAQMYHDRFGNGIAVARPFNLVGPGQPDSFICGRIIRQVVGIEQGRLDEIDLLETSSRRDFIDVRDAVRAYYALISHAGFHGECAGKTFNIGSGKSTSIREVIGSIEGITGRRYHVRLPDIPPAITIPGQKSDNGKITALTGWEPAIPLERSLLDMLRAERNKAHCW